MLFQNTLLGVVSLASLASAGIVSFSIPKTVVPGAKFTATLTDNNATKSHDISIAFGIANGPYVETWGVGTDLLGKSLLNNTGEISPQARGSTQRETNTSKQTSRPPRRPSTSS